MTIDHGRNWQIVRAIIETSPPGWSKVGRELVNPNVGVLRECNYGLWTQFLSTRTGLIYVISKPIAKARKVAERVNRQIIEEMH